MENPVDKSVFIHSSCVKLYFFTIFIVEKYFFINRSVDLDKKIDKYLKNMVIFIIIFDKEILVNLL